MRHADQKSRQYHVEVNTPKIQIITILRRSQNSAQVPAQTLPSQIPHKGTTLPTTLLLLPPPQPRNHQPLAPIHAGNYSIGLPLLVHYPPYSLGPTNILSTQSLNHDLQASPATSPSPGEKPALPKTTDARRRRNTNTHL
ncbi:hypothetical protein O988_09336 [Pseudogymnoascus sp. VKM F-3808]|nr:hypothetical protein O988_09336 [Pseudogymnoascus sp. VKM F-3808]